MAKLIIITGLPGSGKSTVAQLLSEKMRADILRSDAVRRELFPVRRTHSPEETKAVIEETTRRVREKLASGKDVIIDALFTKQRAREGYRALASSLGVDVHIVLIVSSEDETRLRLDLRAMTDDPREATFALYLDRKPRFEQVRGPHFIIDNTGTMDVLKEKVETLYSKYLSAT